MIRSITTIVLLIVSNTFMTFGWYGHLKFHSTCKKKSPANGASFNLLGYPKLLFVGFFNRLDQVFLD